MGDTLAKLKVILEASTASYKKEMEKAQKVTKTSVILLSLKHQKSNRL